MLIPHSELEPATLENLLVDLVTRDGTDNGYDDTLDERVGKLRVLLDRRQAFITFNHEYQQCCLVRREDLPPAELRKWLEDA